MSKDRQSFQGEGIMEKGYGFIPKLIMKDKELTIEAKSIYAYLSSYTGAGNTAYPSISLMCGDLSISEARFYKHRKLLVEKGYIVIEKKRNEGGWSNNVYRLPFKPSPQEPAEEELEVEELDEQEPYPQNLSTQKPYPQNLSTQNLSTQNLSTQNMGTKSISLKSNSLKSNNLKRRYSATEIAQTFIKDIEDARKQAYKINDKISIEDNFERVWKLYPSKKGKGRIKATKRKEVYNLGAEFDRCIERYIEYVKNIRETGFNELQYQNGSTFFNSGYVDYLDDNYVEVDNCGESRNNGKGTSKEADRLKELAIKEGLIGKDGQIEEVGEIDF